MTNDTQAKLPAVVEEWVNSYTEYAKTNKAYNARMRELHEEEKARPVQRASVFPVIEYQATQDCERVHRAFLPALHAALTALVSTLQGQAEKPPVDIDAVVVKTGAENDK